MEIERLKKISGDRLMQIDRERENEQNFRNKREKKLAEDREVRGELYRSLCQRNFVEEKIVDHWRRNIVYKLELLSNCRERNFYPKAKEQFFTKNQKKLSPQIRVQERRALQHRVVCRVVSIFYFL